MQGISKANLICIKCNKTFTDRKGATVKGGFFFCKECTEKLKDKK
jgi:predicted SprT family Zn-dependent metalloprotease